MLKSIGIDLMMTRRCNFRCSYCYEHDYKYSGDITPEVLHQLPKFITELSNNVPHQEMMITFWGGEPTLKSNEIIDIVEQFHKDRYLNSIKYAIITNGYNLDKLRNVLVDWKQSGIDFFVQVSYDYQPNQRLFRRNLYPDSSSKILDNIYWLAKNNLNFSTKSTINIQGIQNIYEVYLDFLQVREKVKQYNRSKDINLVLTLDTLNMPNKEELNLSLAKFREGMTKIISHQLNNNEQPNLNWLRPDRRLCSVGNNLLSIDTDGSLYPCHGTLFSKVSHLHKYKTNIFNTTNYKSLFRDTVFKDNDKCMDCSACFCLKCNAHCFERSTLQLYDDRMSDFANNDLYCFFQREISKFVYAKQELLKRKR